VTSFESVSTWKQPKAGIDSASRALLIDDIARKVSNLSKGRLRVAIDGRTASGKTTFGDELAAALRLLGRSTLRTSLDDFKKTWRDAKEKGYDRLSGEGYYRNAYDFESATELLLKPSGPEGSGQVVLCAHDALTGQDHRNVFIFAPDDAILVVDSVFAFRSEYNIFWDYRIWIEVSARVSVARGIIRDTDLEGLEEATAVHRDRYQVAEEIYVGEVDPLSLADVIIDNTVFSNPVILLEIG
jgi:uridine kinase